MIVMISTIKLIISVVLKSVVLTSIVVVVIIFITISILLIIVINNAIQNYENKGNENCNMWSNSINQNM